MADYPGTAGADMLTGTSADDNFFGSGGSDTITGGGGSDTLLYGPSGSFAGIAGPITVNFGSTIYSGTVVKSTGTDTFSGIRAVRGTSGSDTLTGTTASGNNQPFSILLVGGGGNDTINGQKSVVNQLSYQTSTAGVVVHLQSSVDGSGNFVGSAQDGLGGTDSLLNIVRVRGSAFSDTTTGTNVQDYFDGTLGSDVYDGYGGSNIVAYDTADFTNGSTSIGVTVGNPLSGLFGLGTATVTKVQTSSGTVVGTDALYDINQVRGTISNDVFVGSTTSYTFYSLRLVGDAGNDTFYGQNSTANQIDYSLAPIAVTVDLAAGTASDGQGGVDTLIGVRAVRGSSFNDTLLGGSESDTFVINAAGLHTINGREGTNRVNYNGSNAVTIDLGTVATTDGFGGYVGTLTKSAGTDMLSNIGNASGGDGNDIIYGTPGDNILAGSGGNNTIDGRGGYDTVSFQGFVNFVPTHGATINLNDGVSGTASNPFDGTDTLMNIEGAVGSQQADDITGATLASGLYSMIEGYGGNDILRAASTAAHVMVTYANSLSAVRVDLGNHITTDDGWFGGQDTLVNIEAAQGSSFNDVLIGDGQGNLLLGGAGDDVLLGGAGNDTLVGAIGNDTYEVTDAGDSVLEIANEGTDTVFSYLNSYTLPANVENLVLSGNAITGIGNDLDNRIVGTDANNVLLGGAGADIMVGGNGNDIYEVDNVGDVVFELPNQGTADNVYAYVDFTLPDNVDNLIMSYGNQRFGIGNAGDNIIIGNAQDNVIQGGAGYDVLTGGAGSDAFVVNPNWGVDLITDFTAGAGTPDAVLFSKAIFQTFGQVMANSAQVGADVYIGDGYGDTVVLQHVTLAQLSPDDFGFF